MTIKFNYNDKFIENSFNSLIQQKFNQNILIDEKSLFIVNVIKNINSKIKIECLNFDSKILSIPIHFYSFSKEIESFCNLFFFDYNILKFYPFLNKITNDHEQLLLNDIHNKILINLISNKDVGINKFDLYKFLWSRDADISINKLDTHLTNLKNLIFEKFEIHLKFKSIKNLLYLD